MSASSNILREYLVSLGFRVDTAGGKRAQGTMDSLDKTARQLGSSIVKVGAAVTGMVAIFSYQMEKLYYASKRTDSAVGSIQAMEFGAKQIGISGDAIRGALEGMARAMRSNPGLTGLLNSLGVSVQGRDKADVMADLVEQLSKMPFATAKSIASLFGIDEDTLFMLIQGKDKMAEMAKMRKQMAADVGVDTEAAAKAGMEYAHGLLVMTERVGLLKDALAVALLPTFNAVSDSMGKGLEILTKIVGKSTSLTDFAERFARQFGRGVKNLWNEYVGSSPQEAPKSAPGAAKGQAGSQPPTTGSPNAPRGVRNNNPGNLNFAGQPGAQLETGVEKPRFAKFGSMEEGVSALASQLQRYYQRGLNTLQDIVHRYAPQADGNNEKAYVEALVRSTGFAANQKLNLQDPYVLKAVTQGIIRQEGSASGVTQAQIDRAFQIHQTNNINVTGVSDPAKAAHEIQKAQQISNADMQRQFQPRSR